MTEAAIGIQPMILPVEDRELCISDISGLKSHVTSRSPFFVKRLAVAAAAIDLTEAWETDNKYDTPETIHKDAVFTGAGMCGVASAAVAEALTTIAPQFSTSVIVFEEIPERKRLRTASRLSVPAIHYVVLTTDREGQSLLIDGTYSQIDRRFAGTILCVDEAERFAYLPYPSYADEIYGQELEDFITERQYGLSAQSRDNTAYTRIVRTLL